MYLLRKDRLIYSVALVFIANLTLSSRLILGFNLYCNYFIDIDIE